MSDIYKSIERKPSYRFDFLAVVAGVMGLILAFMPYLSIIGIILGLLAILFSIRAFRQRQRSLWAWLGLLFGCLVLLAFFIVIALIQFF